MSDDRVPFGGENITGRRFGRLVVLGRIRYGRTQSRWICRCDCGGLYFGLTNAVMKAYDCGCARREAMLSLFADKVLKVLHANGSMSRGDISLKLTRTNKISMALALLEKDGKVRRKQRYKRGQVVAFWSTTFGRDERPQAGGGIDGIMLLSICL
jgi:hypothetical protein